MIDCSSLEPLVTPYIDGELTATDRLSVAEHIRVCSPCRSRVAAEQAARDVLKARKATWLCEQAPPALRARCFALANGARVRPDHTSPTLVARSGDQRQPQNGPFALGQALRAGPTVSQSHPPGGQTARVNWSTWRARLAPLALAATLVVIVSGAFLYRMTEASSRLMAAELTADHIKCFALNALLRTHQSPSVVEGYLASSFDWPVRLDTSDEELELVGSRPCLYAEGRVAHIMFKHHGHPVSLFMLPGSSRREELMSVLGHEASIWCVANRTFVLIANESKSDVEHMASLVRGSLK